MRRLVITSCLIATSVVSAASIAAAQSGHAARFLDNCHNNGGDEERFCEVRNFTLPAGRALNVDGRENGGITVHGWDQPGIQVVAMIQAQAESQAEAQGIAKAVNILTNGSEVRSDGPDTGHRQSWSVSYEVYAPRHTDLTLTAMNGGLAVDGIESRMDLRTVNGGLSLSNVNGDVHGVTMNGGISADLNGDRWQGAGLDVTTTNGGVKVYLPANYSAQLETGTTNGHMNIDFPVTVQGALTRRLSTQIGGGGATIRAMTTNGGVSISRR
ncbi:MAG TPA: DUF4097 family beta strand repeat-containing protein [Gemmatimonadaceae bacterium]|nr:DUF4097 family beta strand repeat-containing protein [Gemmatimonadaceae bacterium]